jgi:phospholipid/cholesterol/gamma-HCH transport system substrate-binding protein
MNMQGARLAGVGVFVLAGAALFTVALFMIGDRQMAFATKFTVYTEFAKITGLQPGAVIRVSGAKAGSVKEIEPPASPAGRFRVRMEITDDLRQLVRTDSVAAIETEGLVGGSFLAVTTGSAGAPEAPEGSTIPSREPFQIADLLQQMSDTIRKVNATIDDLKGGIEDAITLVGDTMDNANALIDDVNDDVKTMTSAGARISGDVAEIAEHIRKGEGTIGRLLKDDELYRRATGIAKSAEEIAADAREVVRQARRALDDFQSKDGAVGGLTGNLKDTLDEARTAMVGLAENMEALKRNFLFRGFFNNRGYFDLADISPAEYRQGALTAEGDRQPVRIWLHDNVIFERGTNGGDDMRIAEGGKARLDSALAPYLDRLGDSVVMIEGYADQGTEDERYLGSRARAVAARDYLIGKFHLDPRSTGAMPLGSETTGSPQGTRWSGIALAVFMEKR